jgi:rRNA-processing protein FCF1
MSCAPRTRFIPHVRIINSSYNHADQDDRDTLYAKCIPIITSCVMAELEKLGPK